MSAEALVVRAFDIDVPESELEELRHRVERTRWPDEPLDAGEELGVSLRYIRRLVEYWLSGYDWRKQEAALNALPQYRTRIDGEDLHFVHIRSPHDDAIPLILIHGWPSSFVEFAGLVPELGTPSIEG